MLKVYSFGRFGIVLLLLTLLLSSFGAASAKGPVEEETVEFDPHASVSSDGSIVEQDLSGVRYDRFGAYVPEVAGSGKQVHGPDRVADDAHLNPQPATPDGNAAPDSVIGDDDRVHITNTTVVPYRRIAYVTYKHLSIEYSCSGWLISADTVATAGHCIYMNYSWVTDVRVYPGRDGSITPYGSCGAKRLYAAAGWVNKRNYDYDYGVIKLDCSVGKQTGSFGYRIAPDDGLVDQRAKIAGYPGEKPTGTMWYHSDKVTSYNSLWVIYTTDLTGGQSGSPVYNSRANCSYCAIAINTLHDRITNTNRGIRITRPVFNNLTSWKNAK